MFITLTSTNILFLLPLLMCFSCYDSLKFPLTFIGKVKVGLYCYLIADILTKVLQRFSLSSPQPNVLILSKLQNWIGCHDNWKNKFVKKYSKIISSEAIRGLKLKICRNAHNISFYRKVLFYYLCSCGFVAMTSFPCLITRKVKVSHCRYFGRLFVE